MANFPRISHQTACNWASSDTEPFDLHPLTVKDIWTGFAFLTSKKGPAKKDFEIQEGTLVTIRTTETRVSRPRPTSPKSLKTKSSQAFRPGVSSKCRKSAHEPRKESKVCQINVPGPFNSVQTRCIAKGEAQKSPLFWRFSGGFGFSQNRLLFRNSTRKP